MTNSLKLSTWGASFSKAWQVYSTVIRLAMTFGVSTWYTLGEVREKAPGQTAKLRTTQNKYLRIVAGAYKATPVRSLEKKTYIPPLDQYISGLVAGARRRLASSGQQLEIEVACHAFRSKLQGRRQRALRLTPGQAKNRWANTWLLAGTQPASRQRGPSPKALK